jgi:hypothetical protein
MQGFETPLQGAGSRCKVIRMAMQGSRKSMQVDRTALQGHPEVGARLPEGRTDRPEVAASLAKCRCKVSETLMQGYRESGRGGPGVLDEPIRFFVCGGFGCERDQTDKRPNAHRPLRLFRRVSARFTVDETITTRKWGPREVSLLHVDPVIHE